MKTSKLYTLIIIAGVALAGLIGVQAYWIHHAYTIKEQQFAQQVNATINRITEDVQSYEVAQIISEVDSPYPVQRNAKTPVLQKAVLDTIIAGKKQFTNVHPVSEGEKYTFLNNAVRNYWQPRNFVQRSFTQVRTNFDVGMSNMQMAGSVSVTQVQQRVVNDRRAQRRMLFDEVIEKLRSTGRHLEERIDKESLDYIIWSELEKSKIDQPYEYAVYEKDCKRKIYWSPHFTPKKENEQFRAALFPFNWIESQPYYLVLYFPKQSNYLFKSIGIIGTSSVLLTLIVILAFAATVIQMIRQKKIASIRTDFVNNVTHELKTPISTISLASQMLNDKSIPNISKNYDHLSSVIADESKRLSQQVEKILQMAIFDHGKIMLKFKELDLNELISVVVRNMSIQVKNKNGQIVTQHKAEYPVAEVDEVHFTNVLFNLIDNAIKYSNGRPDITVSTADEPGGVRILIQDKGIGISKADQKRIFDQFYRVSTGNVHNVKGFGLGLAYVKNVVDAHKGVIHIESESGQGTSFSILLHRQQPKNGPFSK
jgi:two-component system phosphate regulon sensor histidine kinase PhoR